MWRCKSISIVGIDAHNNVKRIGYMGSLLTSKRAVLSIDAGSIAVRDRDVSRYLKVGVGNPRKA